MGAVRAWVTSGILCCPLATQSGQICVPAQSPTDMMKLWSAFNCMFQRLTCPVSRPSKAYTLAASNPWSWYLQEHGH